MKITKGSVSPFGILNDTDCDVEVIFDKDFHENEIIGVHPNDNTATVFLLFSDLLGVVKAHGNVVKFITI